MTFSKHLYLKWETAAVAIKMGNELEDCEHSLILKMAAENFWALTFQPAAS